MVRIVAEWGGICVFGANSVAVGSSNAKSSHNKGWVYSSSAMRMLVAAQQSNIHGKFHNKSIPLPPSIVSLHLSNLPALDSPPGLLKALVDP